MDSDVLQVILAVVGTIIALASGIIAYLQLRQQQVSSAPSNSSAIPNATTDMQATFQEYSNFTPVARIDGLIRVFVNREQELRDLQKALKNRNSLMIIEGFAGTGKTSLAAIFCNKVRRMYAIAWVFCRERDITLQSLAISFVSDERLPNDAGLKRKIGNPHLSTVDFIDLLIAYLTKFRVMLVLDDYHLVRDSGVKQFVETFAQSQSKSSILLTSRTRVEHVANLPLVAIYQLKGLSRISTRDFLKARQLEVDDAILDEVWERAGEGNPGALTIIASMSQRQKVAHTLRKLPSYSQDLSSWVAQLVKDLRPDEVLLAKFIAFCRSPTSAALISHFIGERANVDRDLDRLLDKFLVVRVSDYYAMNSLFGDYLLSIITESEQQHFSSIVAQHFQKQARKLLLGVGAESSYGKLYLETVADYVQAEDKHEEFIRNLFKLLEANYLLPVPGSTGIVLGAGHGTHDKGLSAFGLNLINIEILPEVIDIARTRAEEIAGNITYISADMTKPLNIQGESADIVLNIGSSFGFEDTDEENAFVFKNASYLLKKGRPFVFEYVNGVYWKKHAASIEREVEVVTLANGSMRTAYKIYDPVNKTSLDAIQLRRPDGTGGWFYHFIHYYTKEEVTKMMESAGLRVIAVYGDDKGSAFNADFSKSIIIIAIKE